MDSENDRKEASFFIKSNLTNDLGINSDKPITQNDFDSLLMGLHPESKEKLVSNAITNLDEHREKLKRLDELQSRKDLDDSEKSELNKLRGLRTQGTQTEFHSPKSLGILFEIGDESTKSMIERIERKALEKVAEAIKDDLSTTKTKGNREGMKIDSLAIACFSHRKNRDNEISRHYHLEIPNLCKAEDGSIRGVNFKNLYTNYKKYSSLYLDELAKGLAKEGIQIESDKGYSFRVKNIPKELDKAFSQRTANIDKAFPQYEQAYKEKNGLQRDLTDKEKSFIREKICLEQRKPKDKKIKISELSSQWNKQIEGYGFNPKQMHQSAISRNHNQSWERMDYEKFVSEIKSHIGALEKNPKFNLTERKLDELFSQHSKFYDFNPDKNGKYSLQSIKDNFKSNHLDSSKSTSIRNGKPFTSTQFKLKNDVNLSPSNYSKQNQKSIQNSVKLPESPPVKKFSMGEILKNQKTFNSQQISSIGSVPPSKNPDSFNKAVEAAAGTAGDLSNKSPKERAKINLQLLREQAGVLMYKAFYTEDTKQKNELLSQAGALMQQADMQAHILDKSISMER